MRFQIYNLKEEEKREYILKLWPRSGEKFIPNGGIIDCENDIRLFYYGNGPYREACNEYQFIFDYKGVDMNINIGFDYEADGVHYSLIELIKDNDNLTIDEIMPVLREAINTFANRRFLRNVENLSEKIHIDF